MEVAEEIEMDLILEGRDMDIAENGEGHNDAEPDNHVDPAQGDVEMPMDDANEPLVGDGNVADSQLVGAHPEADPLLGPAAQTLRRSTRNLFPKYSKKKQLLGLPTTDDEGINNCLL